MSEKNHVRQCAGQHQHAFVFSRRGWRSHEIHQDGVRDQRKETGVRKHDQTAFGSLHFVIHYKKKKSGIK